jgi:Spy/CpxP family protein refolding chaperone
MKFTANHPIVKIMFDTTKLFLSLTLALGASTSVGFALSGTDSIDTSSKHHQPNHKIKYPSKPNKLENSIAIAPNPAVDNQPTPEQDRVAIGIGKRLQALNLSAAQKTKIEAIKKSTQTKIEAVMTPEQIKINRKIEVDKLKAKNSNLTAEQKNKLKAERKAEKQKLNLTAEQNAKIKSIREAEAGQIQAVLTPAQQTKFKANLR